MIVMAFSGNENFQVKKKKKNKQQLQQQQQTKKNVNILSTCKAIFRHLKNTLAIFV